MITADLLGLISIGTDGDPATVATLLDPGFPGVVRGLAAGPGAVLYMTTTGGAIAAYDPSQGESETLADGYDELMGIAVDADGNVFAAEAGAGRVIRIPPGRRAETVATGLGRPTGVAVDADGGASSPTPRRARSSRSGLSERGERRPS